jgi:hypothetical protein
VGSRKHHDRARSGRRFRGLIRRDFRRDNGSRGHRQVALAVRRRSMMRRRVSKVVVMSAILASKSTE